MPRRRSHQATARFKQVGSLPYPGFTRCRFAAKEEVVPPARFPGGATRAAPLWDGHRRATSQVAMIPFRKEVRSDSDEDKESGPGANDERMRLMRTNLKHGVWALAIAGIMTAAAFASDRQIK